MASIIHLNINERTSLYNKSQLSPVEMATRLGHFPTAASRWGSDLPSYAVNYMKIRARLYDVVEYMRCGNVPDGFDFVESLKTIGIKKIELAKLLGVSGHTVSVWGNEPPAYAAEIVYSMVLIKGVNNV